MINNEVLIIYSYISTLVYILSIFYEGLITNMLIIARRKKIILELKEYVLSDNF